jgi:hypothetical protein
MVVGHHAQQAVGANFVLESMHHARNKTWEVVDKVASLIRPGMLESEALAQCRTVLQDMGMDRIWHPILIRFGENTRWAGRSTWISRGIG